MVGAGDLDTPTGQMPAAAESRRSGGENPTSRLSPKPASMASDSERQEQAGGMVHLVVPVHHVREPVAMHLNQLPGNPELEGKCGTTTPKAMTGKLRRVMARRT